MTTRQKIYFGAALLLSLVIPAFVRNAFYVNVFILIFLFAYLSSCWNILGGMTGQHSFGHALFFGIGAYTSSLLYIHYGLSPWITMWIGAALAGFMGLFMGYLSFRYGIKGIFFLMVTISFAEIFKIIFFSVERLGGASGLNIPFKGQVQDFQFSEKVYFYYLALIMLLGILWLTRYLKKNRIGYYFMSIRENEDAAKSLGIHVLRYKIIATVISGFFTSLGGTFYAQYFLYIDPVTVFGVPHSVEIVIPAAVGGEGTILGPLLGAIILVPAAEFMRVYLAESFRGAHLIAYGALLVVSVIFMPKGIMGIFRNIRVKREGMGKEEPVLEPAKD
jgi:branched-chain amino acid transport system permease protein